MVICIQKWLCIVLSAFEHQDKCLHPFDSNSEAGKVVKYLQVGKFGMMESQWSHLQIRETKFAYKFLALVCYVL